MEWPVILALAIGIPLVLIPAAFVLYLNIAGTSQIVREARQRQLRRTEILKEAMAILAAAETPPGQPGEFWAGKTPCWKMCSCAAQIRDECPVYVAKSALACWETGGTFCKLTAEGDESSGWDTTICQACPVYLKYGEGKPIQLRPMVTAKIA